MSYKIVVTSDFTRDVKKLAKRHRSLRQDLADFVEELSEDPYTGDRITQDIYKYRIAIKSKGRGKSGGGRVIAALLKIVRTKTERLDIVLLRIYDKSDRSTLPTHELERQINQYYEEE